MNTLANAEAVLVQVKGNHLAHRIDQANSGRVFKLSSMFSSDSQLGGDKFNAVLVTTRSGNMYLLTENGLLVNHDRSVELGKLHVTELDIDEWLLETELTVGYSLFYRHAKEGKPTHGNTSPITEIVPFLMRMHTAEYLADMPYCDAMERFEEGMPQGGDVHTLMRRASLALA